MAKHSKTHFELTPANAKRLEAFLRVYNEQEERVTSRYKIGDIINASLNEWLSSLTPDSVKKENG